MISPTFVLYILLQLLTSHLVSFSIRKTTKKNSDLKPENIMLDADGHIRLTDLGLCSVIQPDQKLHRHCGTRSYMG